jgi:predicted transglutaminase-like cysteine proteinase
MTRFFTRAHVLALGLPWLLLSSVSSEARVPLNAERMRQLSEVNQRVNTTVTEVTDLEQYGREDVWRIPTNGKGDCEDFALLKRQMLVQRGWLASTLQIAVVLTREGEPHAVLVVGTDQGLLTLDNKTGTIRPLGATGYTVVSMQSRRNSGSWISATTGEETARPTVDLPVRR